MKKLCLLLVPVLTMTGCTWVKLDKKGESVAVVQAKYITSCRTLGKITSKVVVDVGGVKRSPRKVERELETLARNDATGMGGDTIVIASPVTTTRTTKFKKSARRSFNVYACGAR